MSHRRRAKKLKKNRHNRYLGKLEEDHKFLRNMYRAIVHERNELRKDLLYTDRVLRRVLEVWMDEDVGKTK